MKSFHVSKCFSRAIFAAGFIILPVFLSACQKEPDPETAVRESIAAFSEENQYSFDISLKGKGQDDKGKLLDFSMQAVGSGNTEDRKNPEGQTDITLSFSAEEVSAKIAVSLQFLPGYFYVKLNELTLPESSLPPDSTKQFLDQWWEVPIPEENAFFKNAPEERKKILALLKTTSLFQNITKVGEEDVKGEESRKYRVDLNPEAFVAFMEEAVKILKPGETPPEEEKNALIEAFKKIDFSGNLWVSKSDGALRKVAGTARMTPETGGALSIDFEGTFWDFGKKIAYEKPEGATPFDPILLLGLMSSLPGLPGGQTPAFEPVPEEGAETPIDNPLGAAQAGE